MALVEYRDPVAACGELAGAGESGRPRADDGDQTSRRRLAPAKGAALRQRGVGGMTLQPPDLDRLPALVDEHARAFAEELRRAHARAGAAEQVVGEDHLRRPLEVTVGDRGDEGRHVDAGGAGDRTGCRRVRPAALQATIGLHERIQRIERRLDLLEQPALDLGQHRHHTDIVRPRSCLLHRGLH